MNTKNILALFAATLAASAMADDGEMSRPQGIPIGQRMTLRPYVSLSFTYDSNVDQMKHSQDGSQWIVNPGLDLVYRGENWSIEGAVWYQYHAYNNYSHQLNQSNYGEHIKAAWTNSKQDERGWSALLAERFQQINQDDDLRSNNGRGIGRDRKELTVDGILERRVNEYLHASVLGNYYYLDYDNSVHKYASLYGWKRTRAGAEIGYAPTKWTDFILHADYQWYKQDNDSDRNPSEGARGRRISSESSGWSVMGGLATHATEKITYRLLGGWSRFEYGNGAKDIDGWTYEVSSNWKYSDTLNFMLLGSSYYQPSEREYGSCIKVYTLSLGADIWTARVRLNYTLNRYLTLFSGVEYQTEETSGGGIRGHEYDYDRWRGTVGVRLTY